MASPQDALSESALLELYKDFKDNLRIPAPFRDFLKQKVDMRDPCEISEFLAAVAGNEAAVIRFFRKFTRLRPGFVRTELLEVDMRQKGQVVNSLRAFLLYNQGVQSQTQAVTNTTPIAVIPTPRRDFVVSDGKVYAAPVTSGPMAKKQSNPSNSQSPLPAVLPKNHSQSAQAPHRRMDDVAQPKIKPNQLWKNAALKAPESVSKISSGELGYAQASPPSFSMRMASTPENSAAASDASSGKKGYSETSRSETKRQALSEDDVIDLLLDEDESDNTSSGVYLVAAPAASLAVPPLSSHNQSAKASNVLPQSSVVRRNGSTLGTTEGRSDRLPPQIHKTALIAAGTVPPNHQDFLKVSSGATGAGTAPAKHQTGSTKYQSKTINIPAQAKVKSAAVPSVDPMIEHYAQSFSRSLEIDIAYCRKVLAECGTNVSSARMRLEQYRVDLEEARVMDQARLMSESTAADDRKRAANERSQLLATQAAVAEFAGSELMKHASVVRTYLSRSESSLSVSGIRLRRIFVEYLEEERKAIRWYNDAAMAYMRALSRRIPTNVDSVAFFTEELKDLKEILYATSSDAGAPPKFLAALDSETSGVMPGQILGISPEAPVEIA